MTGMPTPTGPSEPTERAGAYDELPQPRTDYAGGRLDDGALDPDDPMGVVRAWVQDAIDAGLPEPTAMTLATVDAGGVPDARIVLARTIDARGVAWFSNRTSAKGRQLADRPVAAVVWYWPQLERQLRLRGRVTHLPDAESDAYFATRPRDSQIGAWASDQSAPVEDRAGLEARASALAARFGDDEHVPRPPTWGGELLRPDTIELWQGRPARLHDRMRYTRTVDGWRLERLMP